MNETTITTALETALTVTTETDGLVESVGEEVEKASSILSAVFTPIKNALPSLVVAIIIAIIGFALIKYLLRLIGHGLERSSMGHIAAGFLRSVLRIVLFAILAVIVLSVLNVPMDSIVAIIASAGVAVGLALKDSLSNIAGGFILLFAKPVKEGDIVEVEGAKGTVEQIDILYTKIVMSDNTVAFIPNGKVSTAKIVNYTEKETRRVELTLGIAYEADLNKARSVILEVVDRHPLTLADPVPTVSVSCHGESCVELLLRVWCKSTDYWTVYYDMLEQSKQAFDQHQIEIPYRKMELHLSRTEEDVNNV